MRDSTFITIFLLLSILAAALGAGNIRQMRVQQAEKVADQLVTQENLKTAQYIATSQERVARAVVTLPDGNLLVTLVDGKGSYSPDTLAKNKNKGLVMVGQILGKKLLPGVPGGMSPRLDLFVPMTVTHDSSGGSAYIILFGDRGDAAIERSYVRLGSDTGVSIISAKAIDADPTLTDQEYRLDIVYTVKDSDNKKPPVQKETVVPVADGRFSTKGVVTTVLSPQ